MRRRSRLRVLVAAQREGRLRERLCHEVELECRGHAGSDNAVNPDDVAGVELGEGIGIAGCPADELGVGQVVSNFHPAS